MYRSDPVTLAIITTVGNYCCSHNAIVVNRTSAATIVFENGRFLADVFTQTWFMDTRIICTNLDSRVQARTMKERGNVRNCHGNNRTIAIIATTGEAINRVFYKENGRQRGGWMAEGKKIIKNSPTLFGVKNKNRYFFIGRIFYYYNHHYHYYYYYYSALFPTPCTAPGELRSHRLLFLILYSCSEISTHTCAPRLDSPVHTQTIYT